jgi:hypothetical protein
MTNPTKMIGDYTPGFLFDTLRANMDLRSDHALARALEVYPSMISKVRNCQVRFPSALLLRIHEVTGTGIRDLRSLIGDRRSKHRIGKELFALRGTSSFRLENASPAPATPLRNSRHSLH